MSSNVNLPWWLKPFNRVVVALQRLGVVVGTMRLLSVPGRKSGKLRTTPVSPLTVEGRRYIVGGFRRAGWVKNARAADWAILARGRKAERVRLVEVPVEQRPPILREFPRQVPHGVQYFERILGLPNDPEGFAAAALHCPVFRFDPMPEEDYEHAPTARGSRERHVTERKNTMKPSISRTLIAGLAGGAAFSVVSFLTFVLIGSGPLFDPDMQSSKVIAVWTQMEPLPLLVTAPYVMLLGYLLFGIGHAFLFRSVAAAWPEGLTPRTWRLAVVIWGLSCLFFEFLGPFNLLSEPLSLVALELSFWAAAALADSTVVVSILRQGPFSLPNNQQR